MTQPPAAPRISTKLRNAIVYRCRGGLPIKVACTKAGLSESAWFKAMSRPHVRELLAQEQARAVTEIDSLRLTARRLALEVAMDLMQHAKSEAVRAKMAEVIGKEPVPLTPAVQVHVDARQGGGYEYAPRGSRIVEIEPPSTQVIEHEGAREDARDERASR